jgi:SSS family transporter
MPIAVDIAIILIYFAVISTIGLVMGRREKSLLDFALGGRQVPWWAIMASIIAAETSAATFLGAPTEGFKNQSLAYVLLAFGVILGRWVVANIFLKPYYTYKVYTVYDYLEIRFGKTTKNFVSVLFLVMRTLASGTRLFVPSIVMVLAWQVLMNGGKPIVVSQQPVDTVFPYVIAIGILSLITAVYTTKGGIKAVIWTDLVQATLMFGTALLAVWSLLSHIGGFGALAHLVPRMSTAGGYFVSGFDHSSIQDWQVAQKMIPKGAPALPMGFMDYVKEIFTNDYTLVSALVASTAMNIAAFGTDQDMVQRLLTADTTKRAKRSLMTAAFMDIPIGGVFTFIGVLLVAYYKLNPALQPKAAADVFGAYILNVMPVGLRGLVLAGVFATCMGSQSAALNSLASSATNDFYVPFHAKRGALDQAQILRAARWFTLLFAVLMFAVAVAFAYLKVKQPDIGIIPVVLGIAGYILGPMLGVFMLGMFTKGRGSDTGNVAGLIVGLLAVSILGDLPGKINKHLSLNLCWQISFTWYAFIGAAAVLLVGVWFKTPNEVLRRAALREHQAQTGEDVPLAMRSGV